MVVEMLAYHFGYGAFGPARKGKRLRPSLLIETAEAEGAALEDALDAAAAIEILHNYSLVHDDIEDQDELRHGRQTLWVKYGIAQAVNAGDAMCALSFLTLAHAQQHHQPGRVLRMIEILHDAHLTMCNGQALDLQFEAASSVEMAEYERMIACKTSALFGAACELGALCVDAHGAGVDNATIARHRERGLAYGRAFQIRDDVLGIWGVSNATGKVAGTDIVRRKWTFPIVWALSRPASAARSVIADAYASGKAIAQEEAQRVIAALDELGARAASERAAECASERIEIV